jgi:hypothetical protein
VSRWLQEPVDEVWVLDGGGQFHSHLKSAHLAVFNLPRDLGTKMDYAFALLTEGDIVVLADDDVLVESGFAADLYRVWEAKEGFVGIIGRTFHGPRYWGDTTFYRASLIAEPTRVAFCGVIIMAARSLFGFDVRGCPRNCDDLWMQMKVHPDVPKHVAPTVHYKNLPEAKDNSAMYRNPSLRLQREKFYKHLYELVYAPTGRIY